MYQFIIKLHLQLTYRIAGNFGEVFNLVNWRFNGKSPNLKPYFIHYRSMRKRSRLPNFKIRQCILMTDSPNLMLAKVSRYTVLIISWFLNSPCSMSFGLCHVLNTSIFYVRS